MGANDGLEHVELCGRWGYMQLSLPRPFLLVQGGNPSRGEQRQRGALPALQAHSHAPGEVRRCTGLRARNLSPWKGSKHFTSFN